MASQTDAIESNKRPTRNIRGYVIVASDFIIQTVIWGIVTSIGLYNIDFLDTFDVSLTAVSLVGALNLGIFLGSGPVASALMTKWGHRRVAMFGVMLSTIGLTCMPFAPNLQYMYVFYGVFTGLGHSFLYIPSLILCGVYFPEQESLATGVAAAGAGVGSAIFPIIIYELIEKFGWRGSMFILAGLNLNLLVFAALLKPLTVSKSINVNVKPYSVTPDDVKEKNETARPVYDIEVYDMNSTSEEAGRKESNVKQPGEDVRSKLRKISSIIRTSTSTKNVVYFGIYCVNNICWNSTFGTATVFIPQYMISKGLTKENASVGLVVIGVGGFVGSVCTGTLGNIKGCDRIKLYSFWSCAFAVAFFLFLIPRFQTYTGLLILISSAGFGYGSILGLLVVITTDLLGPKLTGIGYGILMLANGIGLSVGPPIAGALIDAFGNSDMAMYTCGLFGALGGVLMWIIPLHQKYISYKKKKIFVVMSNLVQP